GETPEGLFVCGKPIGAKPDGRAFGVPAEQNEVPIIGNKNLTILAPVTADLIAGSGDEGVVFGGLDLDCATPRFLSGHGFGVFHPLKLIFGEEAAVRKAGPTILEIDDAADFGLEFAANGVEQVAKR